MLRTIDISGLNHVSLIVVSFAVVFGDAKETTLIVVPVICENVANEQLQSFSNQSWTEPETWSHRKYDITVMAAYNENLNKKISTLLQFGPQKSGRNHGVFVLRGSTVF